ncbi:MAG: urease accessory protein UreF [Leptolyngbya sp. SIO4C1]|nr:urease accessory protein UreF [Leptolyngbya sp. SIO4C1]
MTMPEAALLRLLQLASPALPVGAFSYSEGLETLTQQQRLPSAEALTHWLTQELQVGAVPLEAAIALRIHQSFHQPDRLRYWNTWLLAARETAELRQQSTQMGRALCRLLAQLHPELAPTIAACGTPCNFATAFAIAAAHWQISAETTVLAYLQSWAANLISAAVKLIPLGQTGGQAVLLSLTGAIADTTQTVLQLDDAQLTSSGWGAVLASMQHETLYTRLFRS